MAWILVTPSSRGIGFALTRHLLQTTPSSVPIVATTRSSDPQQTKEQLLADLALDNSNSSSSVSSRLDVQTVDLLSESSIENLATYCKDRYNSRPKDKSNPTHLRLGFFLPGMLKPEKSPQQIILEDALDTYKLNLIAPMLLLKHFIPFLPRKAIKLDATSGGDGTNGEGGEDELKGLPAKSALIACMSARVGSITDNAMGGWYSYRASKAGLNQIVKSTDLYVKTTSGTNAGVIALHPGTVKTGLSKEFWANVKKEKLFSPEFAAEKLVDVVNQAGGDVDKYRGRCWDWKGEEIPP